MNEDDLNKSVLSMFGLDDITDEEYREMLREVREKYRWIENSANFPCVLRADDNLFLCNSEDEVSSLIIQCYFMNVELNIADETDLALLVVKERLV